MGVLLFFVSVFLSLIIGTVGMLYGFFVQVYDAHFFESFKGMDKKFLNMAVGVDRFLNVVCHELLNATLITKNSVYKFGNNKETVSSVLGKNEAAGTLTKTGLYICKKLNNLDKKHTFKSIDYKI